jgi:hypothetical protein
LRDWTCPDISSQNLTIFSAAHSFEKMDRSKPSEALEILDKPFEAMFEGRGNAPK